MAGRGGGGGGFHSGGMGGFRSAGPAGGFRGAPVGGFRGAPVGGFRGAPVGGFRTAGPGVRTFAPAPRGTVTAGRFSTVGHPFAPRAFVPFTPIHGGFGHTFFGFHNHFHNHVFFNGCFGFPCGSPFFFGSGFGAGFFFGSPFFGGPFLGAPYYPYYPYYSGDYGYGPPAPPQPTVASYDNGSNTQLAVEVQRLSDEVADLRDEEARRYSQERAAAANSGASMTAKEPSVTVFVFRDGRRISVKSYAIAGQTLWIFDEHAARKFQIAELDAPATEKANAANGVELHLPAPSPNQYESLPHSLIIGIAPELSQPVRDGLATSRILVLARS